ncbi:MAG: tetratricopeptide repeat protein [Candidatus Cyclonatronum sp.]|uniref:helix-turn-helix domain-containing protein n=1 Tax=Cyclonatronum sp. TaxID=3024185 RepID=UPI0025C0FB91|nr:helix-turn-helix domain-containing protein [Cyclonatronum sp.]MCH8487846.1 tetratricopeptide repeat protein [Cyclonatronum sp.]
MAVTYADELETIMLNENRADLLPFLLLIVRDLTITHAATDNPYMRFTQYFETFRPRLNPEAQLISGTHLAALANNLRLYQDAIELMEALEPQKARSATPAVLSNYYRILGNSYYLSGACNRALEFYFNALNYFPEAAQNNPDLPNLSIHKTPYAVHLLKIGNCFRMLGNPEEALTFFQLAKNAYIEDSDDAGIFSAVTNIASVYRSLSRPEDALDIYLSYVDFVVQTGTPLSQAQYFMNLGNIYTDIGRFYEAGESYLQSIQLSQEHGFDYGLAIGQLNIGFSKYKQGMYSEALEAYLAAAPLIEALQLPNESRQLLKNMSSLYAAMNEFELAYSYFSRFHEADRELISAEFKIEAEKLKVKYELHLKNSELLLKQLQIAEQRNQLRMQWIIIVALLLLFLLIAFSAYNRHRSLMSLYERSRELEASQNFYRNYSVSDVEQTDDESPSKALYAAILEQLNNHRIYTQPDLSLSRLAEIISSNTTYVSRAIVTYSEMNFSNFINYHRVLEARRLILKSVDELSTDDLIEACGFNSRASFYRSFKKFTGMSPSEFARLKNQQTPEAVPEMEEN